MKKSVLKSLLMALACAALLFGAAGCAQNSQKGGEASAERIRIQVQCITQYAQN